MGQSEGRSAETPSIWGFLPAAAICLLATAYAGCASPEEGRGEPAGRARVIEDVLALHNEELLAIDGVIGTGIHGKQEDAVIFVIVERPDDEILDRIPKRLEGYSVIVVDAERIREMSGLEAP